MIDKAEDLISTYLGLCDRPVESRDPLPVLSKLEELVGALDPRAFCQALSGALQRHGLPAPAAGSLAQHLGQPDPAPGPVAEPPPAINPTFAIVMSNYNHSKWLPRSVPALCGQTRAPDQVLIVDDKSSDESGDILRAFQKNYKFLQFYENIENTGPCQAIKNIWSKIDSDYVIFAAADDIVSVELLETFEKFVRQHPTIGAVHGMTYVWFPASNRIVVDYPTHLYRNVLGCHSGSEFRRLLLSGPMTINGNVVCFRRSVIDQLGMFDPSLEHVADTFLFQQVLLAAGVCYVEKPLGIFSRHAEQHSTINVRNISRRISVNHRVLDRWNETRHAAFRADILRYPALLENYPLMLRDIVWRTDAWDILLAYAGWSQLRTASAAAGAQVLKGQ